MYVTVISDFVILLINFNREQKSSIRFLLNKTELRNEMIVGDNLFGL